MLFKIKRTPNKNLLDLLTNHFFMKISSEMINIFISIILLRHGVPLLYVIFLLSLRFLCRAGSYLLSDFLMSRLGVKKMLILGNLTYLVYFFILLNIQLTPIWVFLFLFFGALDNVLYWLPFHITFATAKTHHKGLWVAMKKMISVVVGTINPLIGALILSFFGNNAFFFFVIVFMLFSIIPLSMIDSNYFVVKKIKPIKKINFNACKIQFLAGIPNGLISYSWPLIIYFLTENIIELGVILFLVGIIESFFSLGTGYLFDKKMKMVPLIVFTGIFMSLSVVSMSFFPIFFGVIGVVISKSLFEIFNSGFGPLRTLFWYHECNHEKDHNKIYHSVKHSMISWLVGKSFGIFLISLPLFFGQRMEYSILLTLPSIFILTIIFYGLNKHYGRIKRKMDMKKHPHFHHDCTNN